MSGSQLAGKLNKRKIFTLQIYTYIPLSLSIQYEYVI